MIGKQKKLVVDERQRFNMVLEGADAAALLRLQKKLRMTKSGVVRHLIHEADRK